MNWMKGTTKVYDELATYLFDHKGRVIHAQGHVDLDKYYLHPALRPVSYNGVTIYTIERTT